MLLNWCAVSRRERLETELNMERSFVYSLLLVSIFSAAHGQSLCPGSRDTADVSSGCTFLQTSLTGCSKFYAASSFPNNLTRTALEASQAYQTYRGFYTTFDCSEYAELFICLSLAPQCESGAGPRPPCASLCDLVKAQCSQDIFDRGGFGFDVHCLLTCQRYPNSEGTGNCVAVDDPLVAAISRSQPPDPISSTQSANISTLCPLPSKTFFSDSSKEFALGWVAFWSILCFVSTSLTIFTFLLDTSRFQYPWRPVVYLAIAFCVHSLAYFLSMAIGRANITCPRGQFVYSSISWGWEHAPCIIIFGVLYYTMMAAFLWWLMLTLCWLLASAFKWSTEHIAQLFPFYHVVAWVLPLLMTVSLMAARAIGADELTATCFVVRDDSQKSFFALLIGVILPLVIFLVVGVVFLFIGFVSMIRIHRFMRHKGKEKETMIIEKLMIRIGVFVAVYIIPASVMIGCFVYELVSRPSWGHESCSNCTKANSPVFMVRVFMFLLIGALTGVWIWSKKTLNSWKKIPYRITLCFHGSRTAQSRPTSAANPVIQTHTQAASYFEEEGSMSYFHQPESSHNMINNGNGVLPEGTPL